MEDATTYPGQAVSHDQTLDALNPVDGLDDWFKNPLEAKPPTGDL
jgi:hypothetical protein